MKGEKMTKLPQKLPRKSSVSTETLRLALLQKDAPKDKKGKPLKVAPKKEVSKMQAALYWVLGRNTRR